MELCGVEGPIFKSPSAGKWVFGLLGRKLVQNHIHQGQKDFGSHILDSAVTVYIISIEYRNFASGKCSVSSLSRIYITTVLEWGLIVRVRRQAFLPVYSWCESQQIASRAVFYLRHTNCSCQRLPVYYLLWKRLVLPTSICD